MLLQLVQVQCSWVKQVIPDGLGVSWLHELGGMLSPKAGRVTISLVPFLRGRVGSRLLVTVCCVPWVSGAPLFGCMLWRKQSFDAEVSVVNSLGGVDQVAVMHKGACGFKSSCKIINSSPQMSQVPEKWAEF